MPNTLSGVLAYARNHPTPPTGEGTWDELCEEFVDKAGGFLQYLPTATAARRRSHLYAPSAFKSIYSVPAGWLLWWDFVGHDGVDYGHVAFKVDSSRALMASGFITAPFNSGSKALGFIDAGAYARASGHRWLGASPDHAGLSLLGIDRTLPSVQQFYTVASGNTLTSIASAHGLTLAQLEKLNPQITDPNTISVGQKVRVA